MPFCTKCGSQVGVEGKFCQNCGAPISLNNQVVYDNINRSVGNNGNLSPEEAEELAKLEIAVALGYKKVVGLFVWGAILAIPGAIMFGAAIINMDVRSFSDLLMFITLLVFFLGISITMIIIGILVNTNRMKIYNRRVARVAELKKKRGY